MKFKPHFLIFISILSMTVGTSAMPISEIKTTSAPKPLGAYSQATLVDLSHGKLLFISGQVAIDPKTGKLHEEDIQIATNQTLNNIGEILKAAGSDWKYVARMDVFLKNFADWDGMNIEYIKRFPNGIYPARQTVEVGMENRIEISAIALVPNK
jgi:2-iminobutanoate/2-iminopropanoate deaminase